jgi:hypothetical protein
LRLLLDAGASGYGYRLNAFDGDGAGVSLEALPRGEWTSTLAGLETRVEVYAGRREHLFRFRVDSNTVRDRRGVWEVGAATTGVLGPAAVTAEGAWLRAAEAGYPYVGLRVQALHPWGRAWADAGRWFADALDDETWGAGASLDVLPFVDVWASYRDAATDPFYLTAPRRAWTLGASVPLGNGAASPAILVAPRVENGVVRIELRAELVATHASSTTHSADDGAADADLFVAGDWTDWKPVPMRRSGSRFTMDARLASGVYRFSFVDAAGTWFVPETYPGRIPDGMGGFQALLIVP